MCSPVLEQDPPDYSIVIPARNEEGFLPATLRDLLAWLDRENLSAEIIVVVEPGQDRTPELVQEAAAGDGRIVPCLNRLARGKGFAVRTGMSLARGTKMNLFMDADLSVPAPFIRRFAELLTVEGGADVVIASRHLPGSRIARRQPLLRRVGGRLFNALVRWTGMASFRDTQCGFKGFRPQASRQLFPQLQTEGFAFDVELLWLARRLGLKVLEEPVEWNNRPGSSVRLWLHGPRALRDLLPLFRR